jgi:hypothetical protein
LPVPPASAALAWDGTCASTLSRARKAARGLASAPGGIDSRTVAGDSDEASVDGSTPVLRDIDSPTVAGDLDEPADNGSGPTVGSRSSVGDWFGVSAVCAGAAGALDVDSGAVVGGRPVMVGGSGGCVGSTDIQ